MPRIFVSYRREDSAYVAAAINEKLEQRFGVDSVFFDIDSVPLGTDFRKHISDSVEKCDALLAIIGDTWIDAVDDQGNQRLKDAADFVRLEIESALKRKIPVIPVLVGEARIPTMTDLPSSLQDLPFRNAAEVRAGRDLQQHLTRLVKGIESLSQSEQPKKNQTALRSPQTSSSESIVAKAPRSSTTVSAEPNRFTEYLRKLHHPTLESGARGTPRKRWVFSLLIFISFLVAGFGAGGGVASVAGFDAAGFIVAVPTWLAGIVLTYRAWRRYQRS